MHQIYSISFQKSSFRDPCKTSSIRNRKLGLKKKKQKIIHARRCKTNTFIARNLKQEKITCCPREHFHIFAWHLLIRLQFIDQTRHVSFGHISKRHHSFGLFSKWIFLLRWQIRDFYF